MIFEKQVFFPGHGNPHFYSSLEKEFWKINRNQLSEISKEEYTDLLYQDTVI